MQPAAHPGFPDVDRLHPERRLGASRHRGYDTVGYSVSTALVICDYVHVRVTRVGGSAAADRVRRRCRRGVAVVAVAAPRRRRSGGRGDRARRPHRAARRARRSRRHGRLVRSWAPPPPAGVAARPLVDRSGRVRRPGPDRRRRALGRLGAVRGRPARRRRAAGGVLRLRARVRVPVRPARGVGGAPAGHAARLGARRRRSGSPARTSASIRPRSPGGWRLVGRTDVALFDVHRDPPALLAPGTRVRLAGA